MNALVRKGKKLAAVRNLAARAKALWRQAVAAEGLAENVFAAAFGPANEAAKQYGEVMLQLAQARRAHAMA